MAVVVFYCVFVVHGCDMAFVVLCCVCVFHGCYMLLCMSPIEQISSDWWSLWVCDCVVLVLIGLCMECSAMFCLTMCCCDIVGCLCVCRGWDSTFHGWDMVIVVCGYGWHSVCLCSSWCHQQRFFWKNGKPKSNVHHMFMGDNLIAEMLRCMKQAMSASIEALFILLGKPEPKPRTWAICMEKLLIVFFSHEKTQLGIRINTRTIVVGMPDENILKMVK